MASTQPELKPGALATCVSAFPCRQWKVVDNSGERGARELMLCLDTYRRSGKTMTIRVLKSLPPYAWIIRRFHRYESPLFVDTREVPLYPV